MAVQASELEESMMHHVKEGRGGLLVVTNSGNHAQALNAIELAREGVVNNPCCVFSVVNSVGSQVARSTKIGVYLNAGRERAGVSTKCFLSQVSVLTQIACWFGQNRKEQEETEALIAGFSRLSRQETVVDAPPPRSQLLGQAPPVKDKYDVLRSQLVQALGRTPFSVGLTLKQCGEQCKAIANSEAIRGMRSAIVIGHGYGLPIAQEGALKMKELAHVHASAYSGVHNGVKALVSRDQRSPVFVIVLDDEHAQSMVAAAKSVKTRGAYVVCITDNRQLCDGIADEVGTARNLAACVRKRCRARCVTRWVAWLLTGRRRARGVLRSLFHGLASVPARVRCVPIARRPGIPAGTVVTCEPRAPFLLSLFFFFFFSPPARRAGDRDPAQRAAHGAERRGPAAADRARAVRREGVPPRHGAGG
jgi:fructoselysine-6-P-deglycase FrlB-like protein